MSYDYVDPQVILLLCTITGLCQMLIAVTLIAEVLRGLHLPGTGLGTTY